MKRKTVITSLFLAGALVAGGLSFALASTVKTSEPEKTEATDYSSQSHIDSYYSDVNGSGTSLLSSVCSAVSNPYTSTAYGSLKNKYPITDPRGDGYLYDIYSDNTKYTIDDAGSGASTIGQGWNKEHTIPKSWWGGQETSQGCDIIIVRLSDIHCNSVRSNYIYAEVGTSTKNDIDDNKFGTCSNYSEIGVSSSTTAFEPRDAIKGDMARTYFYAAARYWTSGAGNGGVKTWTTAEGSNVFSASGNNGFDSDYVKMLIRWHREDPVDEREVTRNANVESVQENRNPFVDHPSWVDLIWGGTYPSTALNYEDTSAGEVTNGKLTPSVGITSISKTTASIVNGNSTTISATSSNSGTISWSSSNTNVATVSSPSAASGSNITINAVGIGTSTITASITISGTVYSKTCTVTVTAPKTLSSISVSGQKTTFTVNEAFSFGGTVTAHYSDSSTANVTESATFTGYDMATLGNQTVTVSYTEGTTKTTSYSITVNEQSSGGTYTITYSDSFSPSFPSSESSVNTSSTSHNDSTAGISFYEQGVYKGTTNNYLMFVKDKGFLYNSTAIQYITNISVTYSSGTSTSGKIGVYFGSSLSSVSTYTTSSNQTIKGQSQTDTFTPSNSASSYFQISTSNKNVQITQVVITYSSSSSKALASVATSGQKTSFSTGEYFSYGGTLTATYSDSSYAGVTPTSFKYGASGINPTSAGTAITTSTVMSASTHNGKTIYVLYTEGGVTKYASYTISVSDIAVTSVSLNSSSESINVGGTVTLTATVLPNNATNKNVSWSSSNTSVATVSGGTVTGVAKGTATITVTTQDGSKTDTCTITVLQQVTGVSLDKTLLSLTTGNTGSLVATVTPSTASNKNVTWSTSNSSVATVSNGTVTAVAAGTATITVETVDGGYTDTCSVTVTDPIVHATGVSLNYTTKSVEVDDYFELEATIAPSNATYKSVSWSSSNDEVATVSAGLVRGISAGTATITVTTVDGGHTATCTVTVTSSGGSSETQATIDLTAQGFTNDQEVTSVSSSTGSAQVVFDKGTNNNVPKYYDTGTAVRVYPGGTFTVSSSMYTITSITITFGSGDKTNEITCNVGTFSLPTWTGSSDSVTFTVGGTSGHRRIRSLAITFENSGGTDPDPTPTPTPSNTSFKIIESQAEIMDGTQLVIGYINGNTVKVMKNYESGKYYHYTVDGTYSSETGILTPNEGYSRWTIGDTESGYTFKNANNQYLNANSESYSNLVATSSLEATTYWEITIESDSYHTIRNLNNSSRSWVCYASGYTNFDCEANEVTPGILMFADVAATTQAFVDNYLHMSDYTSNLGWCKDQEHGYYEVAKERLLAMGSAYIYEFQENDAFNAAQARYEAWASFNGDTTPYYDSGSNSASLTHASTNNVVTTITVLTLCTLSISAIYLALKHRKFER